jgi:hypothetical protein
MALAVFAGAQLGREGGGQISMVARPAFDGLEPMFGRTAPYVVDLDNQGRDAVGYLRVQAGAYQMDYPVDLPQGAKKRWTVNVPSAIYGDQPKFILSTNREGYTISPPYEPRMGPEAVIAGAITDTTGDLSFLQVTQGSDREYAGVYCKPEDAPDRSFGYATLNALVLGTGSERLPDESVRAIQQWVVAGGTLIFLGGASSPVLADPRWSAFLPVKDPVAKTMSASQLPGGGAADLGSITAMIGTAVQGATASRNDFVIRKPMGIGYSVYLAVNPFESPLNRWERRGALFRELLDAKYVGNVAGFHAVAGLTQNNDPYSGYARAYSPYGVEPSDDGNPFRTSLPTTGTILMILIGYLVVVVPLNFLLLKKLGKGEFAWFSAPVLSLAFSGVFFYTARELYSAQLSTSTKGLLVIAEEAKEGTAVGHTQMFFPRGGNYDLGFENVDAIWLEEQYYGYDGLRPQTMEDMKPVDVGQVRIASMGTPNLAFREIYSRQFSNTEGWLKFEPQGSSLRMKVTNSSPHKMSGIKVYNGELAFAAKDLEAGESTVVDLKVGGAQPARETVEAKASQLVRFGGNYVVTGFVNGYRIGPQIGAEVATESGITLVCSSNDKVRSGL